MREEEEEEEGQTIKERNQPKQKNEDKQNKLLL